MEMIYRGLAEADVLVLSSPVCFGTVSAQAKTVIDRCQALWVAKVKLGRPINPEMRPGCFISAAGQDVPGVFDCSLKVVRVFFNTAQFRLSASVLEPGLDEPGDLDRQTDRLDRARERGLSLSEELKL
jgi:NAD(P)H-dependent FMN reductase